jgi:hypothetical protein
MDFSPPCRHPLPKLKSLTALFQKPFTSTTAFYDDLHSNGYFHDNKSNDLFFEGTGTSEPLGRGRQVSLAARKKKKSP